jgi:hypothetical protein
VAGRSTRSLGVMNKIRRVKRTLQRNYSAHHTLINAAAHANRAAAKKEPGWFFHHLATMTFSALAIEALCNSIGKRVVSDWEDFESASPNAKLRILTERLSVPYKRDAEPWSTAIWLVKFRNLVAHAKPELIVVERIMTQDESDKRLFDDPKSKLEKMITAGNANRALQAAEQIKELLIGKLPPEERFGLISDGWSGHTVAHDA